MEGQYGGDFIVLKDDEGHEFELEHLDSLEHEGVTYMAFTPAKDTDDLEIIILKTTIEDDEEILITVDDENEAEMIYDLFMERISDTFELD